MTDGVLDYGGDFDRLTRTNAVHEKNAVGGNLIPLGGGDEIVADDVVPGIRKWLKTLAGTLTGRVGLLTE